MTHVTFPSRLLGVAVGLGCSYTFTYNTLEGVSTGGAASTVFVPTILTSFDQGFTWQVRYSAALLSTCLRPDVHRLTRHPLTLAPFLPSPCADRHRVLQQAAVVRPDAPAGVKLRPGRRRPGHGRSLSCSGPPLDVLHHPLSVLRRRGLLRDHHRRHLQPGRPRFSADGRARGDQRPRQPQHRRCARRPAPWRRISSRCQHGCTLGLHMCTLRRSS